MSLSVNIQKDLDGFQLDLSWEMGDELAVLFGSSGAGKSLTLRMIAGLMRPDRGAIGMNGTALFDSERSVDLPPQARSLGYVFQDLALFPHMTVEENILYGGHGLGKGERVSQSRSLLKMFRIDGLERRRPSEISGGQKQRVALARALMRRPRALLLDEPFSALDLPLRLELRSVVRDIRIGFGIPVVLVTHDLREACELADRLLVYAKGRVVQSGSPEDVLSNPLSDEVSRLVAFERPRPFPVKDLCCSTAR